jgi:hypothetical protein
MKITISFIIFFWCSLPLGAITKDFPSYILDKKPEKIEKWDRIIQTDEFMIPCDFAHHPIDTTGLSLWLNNYNTVQISLYYTSYKLSPHFDQKYLNRQRILKLFLYIPSLNGNFGMLWKLKEQTDCKNPEEGKNFFHGFVLKGIARPTEASRKKEIETLNSFSAWLSNPNATHADHPILSTASSGNTSETVTPNAAKRFRCADYKGGFNRMRAYVENNQLKPNIMNEYLYQGYIKVQAEVDESGVLINPQVIAADKQWDWSEQEALRLVKGMPAFEPAALDGQPTNSVVTISLYIGKERKPPLLDCIVPENVEEEFASSKLFSPDSLVMNVLEKHQEWKDILIVSDFTGSMIKHNLVVMAWIKKMYANNPERITGMVIFNDGDNKSDKRKRIGETGGIYHTASKNMADILELSRKCMENGSGGDLQENNIEAILFGIQTYPQSKEIVLIADNPATPRDLSLWSKINKPVHVILCETNYLINCDYLNLARNTKGSVHLDGGEYNNLHQLNEGESFEIGNSVFVIKGGKIFPV